MPKLPPVPATGTATGAPVNIILYDGVCNLCWFWVRFILKRDKRRIYRFVPLQSDVARDLMKAKAMVVPELSTVVLIDEHGVFVKSSAILRAMRRLPLPWPLLYVLVVIPRPLRDALYGFIGGRRYRWFGHSDVCYLPDEKDRDRFL